MTAYSPPRPESTMVTLNPVTLNLANTGVTYTVYFDLSAAGAFYDSGYAISALCDETGVVIGENLARKSKTGFELTVFVESTAPVGTYGGAKDLSLTISLYGRWLGSASPILSVLPAAPVAVS